MACSAGLDRVRTNLGLLLADLAAMLPLTTKKLLTLGSSKRLACAAEASAFDKKE